MRSMKSVVVSPAMKLRRLRSVATRKSRLVGDPLHAVCFPMLERVCAPLRDAWGAWAMTFAIIGSKLMLTSVPDSIAGVETSSIEVEGRHTA